MIEFLFAMFSVALVIITVRVVVGRKPGEFIKRTNLLGKLILIFSMLWWVGRFTINFPEAGDRRERVGRAVFGYYSQNTLQRVFEVISDNIFIVPIFLGLVLIVGMKMEKRGH